MNDCEIDSEKLIELVKNSPCIWNRDLDDYKHKDKTIGAWRSVCSEIWNEYDKLNEMKKKHLLLVIKKKWCNIRDHYLKSCKKIRMHASNANGFSSPRPRKYIFYDQLTFLDDIYPQTTSTPPNWNEEQSNRDELSNDDVSQDIDDPVMVYMDDSEEEDTTEQRLTTTNQVQIDESITTHDEKDALPDIDDRHLMFFKSIIPSLRTFTEDQTVEFQLGVLQLIKTTRTPSNKLRTLKRQPSFFINFPNTVSPKNPSKNKRKKPKQSSEEIETATNTNAELAANTNSQITSSVLNVTSPVLSEKSWDSQHSESNF